jgi:hypothetical protein
LSELTAVQLGSDAFQIDHFFFARDNILSHG